MGEERGRGATRAKTPAPSTASRASITRRHGLVALAIYAAVSMVLFGLPILRNFSRAYIGLGLDPPLFMWFLVWWPHALRHWLDPFVTSAVWAPTGVDLAWTTSIPGPSLVAAPLTAVFGPIVAFNVLTLLAPALAAWTAYVLCRHVTRSFWPSLIGGYLFGFSTYELGHQISHLDLTLVFAVPLAVYLVLLGIDGVLGPLAFVGFLAATLVLQFSISTEVFATATVFGAIVMLLALAVAPAGARRRVRSTGGLMLCAYALAALVLIPYLRHVVAGGYPRLQTPIVDPEQYSTDLLNFFMPTPITLIGGHVFDAVTKYFKTNYQEAVAYMSAPLLAIVYLFGRVRWRTAEGQLLLVPFLLACVASLGPTIHVDGVPIVSLWRPLLRLPLLNNALPDRVMMYGFLTAAVIVAVWLGSPDTPRLTKWVLVPLSMLLLLPNIPAGYWQTPVTTPDFFARGLYRGYLASGENTIVIPYGTRGDSMLWQAQAEMYFRMAGGYISPTMPEEFLQWPIFSSLYTGTSVPSYREQLFAFLAAHDVRAILVDDAYTTAPATRAEWPELLGSLGLPSVHVGGSSCTGCRHRFRRSRRRSKCSSASRSTRPPRC